MPGIASPHHLVPKGGLFSEAREIATKVVECVVSELRSCGASDVLVADSHGVMANILPLRADYRLLHGFPRPLSMVLGVEGHSAAALLGYHTGAGVLHGFMAHTYSTAFHRVYLNDRPASEYLINAALAGEKGVPVIMVAGDEELRGEVEKHTPWAVFIPMKRGVSRYATVSEPITHVCDRLRLGVREALERLRSGAAKPLILEKPCRFVVELKDEALADVLEKSKLFKRLDAYTVRFESETVEEGVALLELLAFASLGVQRAMQL